MKKEEKRPQASDFDFGIADYSVKIIYTIYPRLRDRERGPQALTV